MSGSAEQLHGTDSPAFRSSKLPDRPSFGFCVIILSKDIDMKSDDKEPRKLNDDEEMAIQDVRIAMGEYEAHCLRCVLAGTISRLPLDAKKNELVRNFARSRNVKL
jgi:hypothetical protein